LGPSDSAQGGNLIGPTSGGGGAGCHALLGLYCALFRAQVSKSGMRGDLIQAGTLILDPEQPGPSPTLPARMPAEGTVRAWSGRSRTLPPERRPARAECPAPPAGTEAPRAGPGRLGSASRHPSRVRPV
jgi:hypothetical protein